MEEAAEILKSMPNLRVILDHLVFPSVADLEGDAYIEGMKLFAELPNVYLKISFMGKISPSNDEKERELIIKRCRECVKVLSPQRCMFATNFPVDNHTDYGNWSMADLIDFWTKVAEGLTPEE